MKIMCICVTNAQIIFVLTRKTNEKDNNEKKNTQH